MESYVNRDNFYRVCNLERSCVSLYNQKQNVEVLLRFDVIAYIKQFLKTEKDDLGMELFTTEHIAVHLIEPDLETDVYWVDGDTNEFVDKFEQFLEKDDERVR